jgi:hypothetical protein
MELSFLISCIAVEACKCIHCDGAIAIDEEFYLHGSITSGMSFLIHSGPSCKTCKPSATKKLKPLDMYHKWSNIKG